MSEGLHDQAYCDRHVLGFDEAHLPDGAPPALPTSPTCWARATACPDFRMGRGALRHPGRDHPPARDRVRHHQARGPALRLRPGPHGLRRAVPPRRLCAGGDHRQHRHRGRQFRRQQRRHRPRRHQGPADRQQPDRRPGRDAAARRPARQGQGRRLPGRHQDDLFGGRRSLQPVPQRQQDGATRSTAWS